MKPRLVVPKRPEGKGELVEEGERMSMSLAPSRAVPDEQRRWQWCSYGYDPLGLGKDPAQVETYRAYELIHARWAMLAAAGIIIPEGLQVPSTAQ